MRRILLTTCAWAALPGLALAQSLCAPQAGTGQPPPPPPAFTLPAPMPAAAQAWPAGDGAGTARPSVPATVTTPLAAPAASSAAPTAAPPAATQAAAATGATLSAPVLQRVANAGATLEDLGLDHGLRLVVARAGAEFMLLSVLPSGQAMVAGFPMDLTLARLRAIGGSSVTDLGEREGLRGLVLRSGGTFQVFYATPDGERVIPGIMWDAAGRNLTRDHVAGIEGAIPTVTIGDVPAGAPPAPPTAVAPVTVAAPGAAAVSPLAVAQRAHAGVVGAEAAPHIWMFVDPQCGYSVQAMQRFQPLVAAGRLRLSVIPVAILDHANAGRSTADALAMLSHSAEGMVAAWSRGDLRSAPSPEAPGRLRENTAAAAAIALRGTPTLIWRKADGTEGRVDGMPTNIEAVLASATAG